jgi:hypothetical protein
MQNCSSTYLALKHSSECMNSELNPSSFHRLVICLWALPRSVAPEILYADQREVSHAKWASYSTSSPLRMGLRVDLSLLHANMLEILREKDRKTMAKWHIRICHAVFKALGLFRTARNPQSCSSKSGTLGRMRLMRSAGSAKVLRQSQVSGLRVSQAFGRPSIRFPNLFISA